MVENVGFLDESHDLLEKSDLGGGLLNSPELGEWSNIDSVDRSNLENWTNIGSISEGLYLIQVDFIYEGVDDKPRPNGHIFEFSLDISGHIVRNTVYGMSDIANTSIISVWGASSKLDLLMRVSSDIANVNFRYRLIKCKLR